MPRFTVGRQKPTVYLKIANFYQKNNGLGGPMIGSRLVQGIFQT